MLSERPAVVAALAACLVCGLAVVTVLDLDFDPAVWIARIEVTIESWGPLAVLASIGLMVVHSFIPFPAEFLAIANGMVFGAFWGTVITWVGAMLGALLAFAFARRFGRPFVEVMIARRNYHVLEEWTDEHGAQAIFLARFVPLIAFNLVNYLAGLTRLSWWTFSWTTGLGILPVTALLVLVGDRLDQMTWFLWLALLFAALLASWLARRLFSGKPQAIPEP